ncbi:unnamed protein product, partial [Didymodactylos carnosus]
MPTDDTVYTWMKACVKLQEKADKNSAGAALPVSAADLAKCDRVTPTSLIRALTVRCFPNEYDTVTSVRGLDQTRVSEMMAYVISQFPLIQIKRTDLKKAITNC